MSDEIRKAVEKVEKLVKLLATDQGELKRDFGDFNKRMTSTEKLVERLVEDRKETDAALRQIAMSQSAMASAVTQALSQLSLAQSLEKRVERLEGTVFPPKH